MQEPAEAPAEQPSTTSVSSCENLPATFSNEDEAQQSILQAEFKLKDELGEGKSPWLTNAHFYSCNGESGFMIVTTNQDELLHADLPGTVWEEFKNAESPGVYYNNFIRDRYLIPVKDQ